MARFLHVPPHSIWSYLTDLIVGFFISGLFHAITLASVSSNPPPDMIFRSVLFFFMAQVPAICIEQVVTSIYARYISTPESTASTMDWKWKARRILTSIFGHIWVVLWLLFSGWPFMDIYFRVGMASWKMPFSVVERILCLFKQMTGMGDEL